MKILKYITFIAIISLPLITAHSQELKVFDSIPGRSSSEHYLCRVKFEIEDDSAWRNANVLQTTAKTETGYFNVLHGWTASWIAFESDFTNGNIVVEISKKDGSAITEAMVRPVADASKAVILNGKAYVTFSEPANVNVDINGQLENNYTGHGYTGPSVNTISLFANPVFHVPDSNNNNVSVLHPGEDINTLNRADWDTLIFAPGIHNVGMPFEIHDNEVLFIPGDAIVKGTIHPIDAWGDAASQNFKVYGSGTISGEDIVRDPSDKSSIYKPFTKQAENAHLEGFVVADPAFHTFNMNCSKSNPSKPNIYKNLKILAWRVNSDGVNAFRNSEVSDCFFRTQDDAFYLGASNVNQHNNVVWNDANGAVLYLQSATNGSTCAFRDITVIYHRAQWHWWDGGRIISMRETSPGTTISNVHIQNILIEDPLPAFPPFYATMNAGAGEITLNNIIIENVNQEHDGVSTSSDVTRGKPQNTLLGLDNSRIWENITFKDCFFNGKTLTSFADGNFDTSFVDPNTVIFNVLGKNIVTGVSINSCPGSDINMGNTHQFTASVVPTSATDNSVSWSSSNTSVATVDTNGLLTALSEGSTTITVTTNDGGFTSDCIVNVIFPIDSLINAELPDQVSPGDTIMISFTYEASQSRDIQVHIQQNSDPFTNYGSNTKTIIEGIKTDSIDLIVAPGIPLANDAYNISIGLLPVGADWIERLHDIIKTNVNAVNDSASSSITDYFKNNLGANGEIIKLYPNPVKEKLNIEFVDNDKRTISIYSTIGQLIYFQETNEQKIQIDVQSFNAQQHILILVHSETTATSYKILVH